MEAGDEPRGLPPEQLLERSEWATPDLRVVSALAGPPKRSVRSSNSVQAQRWLDSFGRELPRLIPKERVANLVGLPREIAAKLDAVGSVELASLPDDDKVQFDGGRLLVHRDYPEALARLQGAKRKRQRCLLYVAHEVAHVVQGIGAKQHVQELHAAEGEDTLLHIDLEADHAAAVFVAALLDEPIERLKRDSLAMLAAFPVGLSHFPGAALRKTRRAVALAADIECRKIGLFRGDDDYAFVHWTRGGGPATVFLHGRFTRRLLTFTVTAHQAALFDSAASAAGQPRPLLPALKRLLQRAARR